MTESGPRRTPAELSRGKLRALAFRDALALLDCREVLMTSVFGFSYHVTDLFEDATPCSAWPLRPRQGGKELAEIVDRAAAPHA